MKMLLNKLRSALWVILGKPPDTMLLPIYRSDFLDGKLVGIPAQIGRFSLIDYGGNVTIGKNVKIGYGVIILSVSTITGNSDAELIKKPVSIGDNVEIGSNTVILPGVNIGSNTTIGAGAVVNTDIPEGVVAGGIPARIIKKKREHVAKRIT